MKEPEVTLELARAHDLTDDEFEDIRQILGRNPTYTELGIFCVMWSEHCSYKSSRTYLKSLPTSGPVVIEGPGENAGVIDIGDGLAAVFKMESHNHPSFIEPYQGAATGVGGILRDIFTMGARPIASLNSLRFGGPSHPKTPYLLEGVVAGIAGYGNCMGVPTVGGEVYFHPSYSGNNLVNAFNLGIADKDRIFKGLASTAGNPVIYVGSKTGKDGIHGASLLASSEFDDKTEEMRPTVQVGDPFTEKKLLEACLELMRSDAIEGIQDMGAAGLTCSSAEMAGRGGTGMILDLSKVPRRETGMTPYECMLSESQERMLIVAKKGREKFVTKIFKKWDLDVEIVGEVTNDGILKVIEEGKVVVEIPAAKLSDNAPLYKRPKSRPEYLDKVNKLDVSAIEPPKDLSETLVSLLASPNLASARWIYRQYDHMVRLGSVVRPGSDAAVMRVGDGKVGIALSVDCNPVYCYLDPYVGAMSAVAESARNVACAGGRPVAITNCLNFGNPEKPEIMWQFSEAIRGISDACIALNTPVTGGNVSFYNETKGKAIHPTPTIGMVGLLKDVTKHATQWFKADGQIIGLLGATRPELGGGEYLMRVHGIEAGVPPVLDIEIEKAVQAAVIELVENGLISSAHDCSMGGLAVALAKCCITNPKASNGLIGATVELDGDMRPDEILFSESQSRIIISYPKDVSGRVQGIAEKYKVRFAEIGTTRGDSLKINGLIESKLDKMHAAWSKGLEDILK